MGIFEDAAPGPSSNPVPLLHPLFRVRMQASATTLLITLVSNPLSIMATDVSEFAYAGVTVKDAIATTSNPTIFFNFIPLNFL
jgi:hypothetical protein